MHVKLRKQELMRARDMLNRAQEWGVETEFVIAREVFERDGWICHLCGETIPELLRATRVLGGTHEPLSPVIDHVVPLSKGGPHTMENCRAAHWTCNARKYNTLSDTATPDDEALPTVPTQPRTEVEGRRCELVGCARPHYARGLCAPHYKRLRKYGDPNKVRCGCGCGELIMVGGHVAVVTYIDGHGLTGIADSPEAKLRANVTTQAVSERGKTFHGLTDDCVVWTGAKNPAGYGRVYLRVPGRKRKGRSAQVHRLAYELANGDGSAHTLTIDHLCGVRLCCNPNHLEAVTIAENLRRAAVVIMACPEGHPYGADNTDYSPDGHRRCRQCNTDRYHVASHGHAFVADPDNPSEVRRRCLICRQREESTPQFCPYGHEYTPENKRIDTQGKRVCQQCLWDRTHLPQFGHSFLPDPNGGSDKRRRCLTCHESKPERTHCVNGHEYTELTAEYTAKGQRNCVMCRLNAKHVQTHGHEYVIDPDSPATARRCLVCAEAKRATPQFCPYGHEFTPENTRLKSGSRNCRACERNRNHRRLFDHDFVADPHSGKRVRCLHCAAPSRDR
ncbi:HNH endonuclease [Rhodococcus sp. UNC363MFTsu5.1]|uniref:HNH endonuclease n=1 Tax=Rhodococcus sp. UNC363MFTsu5.1 TaxID=1449069 RepID=UPI00068A6F47|nr:HNH endonuclease [Rhodococcus sp. UNC363MFTsu5.1]